MQVIDGTPPTTGQPCIGREMTRLESVLYNLKSWLIWQRRKLPYLVWWNDELDVTVTLSQDKLTAQSLEGAFSQFKSGAFVEVEKIFGEMGIGFDKGLGCEGRDWEWDWSLQGPISVRFRGRCARPERRMERPKPRLAISNIR